MNIAINISRMIISKVLAILFVVMIFGGISSCGQSYTFGIFCYSNECTIEDYDGIYYFIDGFIDRSRKEVKIYVKDGNQNSQLSYKTLVVSENPGLRLKWEKTSHLEIALINETKIEPVRTEYEKSQLLKLLKFELNEQTNQFELVSEDPEGEYLKK